MLSWSLFLYTTFVLLPLPISTDVYNFYCVLNIFNATFICKDRNSGQFCLSVVTVDFCSNRKLTLLILRIKSQPPSTLQWRAAANAQFFHPPSCCFHWESWCFSCACKVHRSAKGLDRGHIQIPLWWLPDLQSFLLFLYAAKHLPTLYSDSLSQLNRFLLQFSCLMPHRWSVPLSRRPYKQTFLSKLFSFKDRLLSRFCAFLVNPHCLHTVISLFKNILPRVY